MLATVWAEGRSYPPLELVEVSSKDDHSDCRVDPEP